MTDIAPEPEYVPRIVKIPADPGQPPTDVTNGDPGVPLPEDPPTP